MKIIPYGRQFIDNRDVKKVSNALIQEKITTGTEVTKFESKLSKYFKCRYAVSCNSGTSAIYMALSAINIKKNDIIIMPAINFVASYNMAKFLGAKVYLADVDQDTGQMSPEKVIECCNKFKLKKIKAIITMYHGGTPLNAEKFFKIKSKFKTFIIEDACHALGAEYSFNNKKFKIGSCRHSDICTFSLHPLKTITTGEGGLVTTNSKKLNDKLRLIRSHGILRDKKKHWNYNVVLRGFNFRLTDFQCALGISQLSKITKIINKRKKIFEFYEKNLKILSKKIKNFKIPKNYNSAHHLYLIKLVKPNLIYKDQLIKFMLKKKVFFQYHYVPIYKFKIFNDKYIGKNADIFYKSVVSIPIYYNLTFKELKYIIKSLKSFFKIHG